jgi:hypothetical protein
MIHLSNRLLKKFLSLSLSLFLVCFCFGKTALAASEASLNFANDDSFYTALGQEVKEGKTINVSTDYKNYSEFPGELKGVVKQENSSNYRLSYWNLASRLAGSTLVGAGIGAAVFGLLSEVVDGDPTPGIQLGIFIGSGFGLGIGALASAMEDHHYKIIVTPGVLQLIPTQY